MLSLWVYDDFLYTGLNAGGVWNYPLSMITSINSIESNNSLHIYPSPSHDIITVITKQNCQNGFILIYGMTSKELIKRKIKGNRNIIDISTLTPGIYLVQYQSKERVSTTKFIKK